MKVSRIYRLLRLITLLQSGRDLTVNDLAAELEVSRRTIFRDLNMLEMAHIPYYYDEARGSYRISRHFFLPPVNLTVTEALAMLVLTGKMRSSTRLPLVSEGTRAAMKLETALPEAIRRQVGSIMDNVHFSPVPVARHEGLDATFDRLAEAIAEREICRMIYISFHERKQITMQVHPLRLVFAGRAWYLIAHSRMHKEIRTFKLSRVRKLAATGKTFMPTADAQLDGYFGDAWSMIPEGRIYNVHLRFDAKVAGNVAEVQWHHSQRVEWNDDGSAEFFVRVDGLGEILWWILGYGQQVEVISPARLRGNVAKVASAVLRKYRGEVD